MYFKFSVYVTMDKLTVLVTLNLISFTVSISLFLLIHKYIERKAPAWQSILDLLLLDGSKTMIVHNCLLFIMNFLGITSGLTIVASEILLGITTSVSMLIISMQEIVLVLKALIIFKPGLLVDLPDLKVINLFRRTSVIASCFRAVWDFFLPPRREMMLEFMTSSKVEIKS